MISILEEKEAFLKEYRAADQNVKDAKIVVCMLQALKWNEIKKGIIAIENEELEGAEEAV